MLGPGSQVMRENYQIYTRQQLERADQAVGDRLERMFPDPELAMLLEARNVLANQFSDHFTPLDWVQDELFVID